MMSIPPNAYRSHPACAIMPLKVLGVRDEAENSSLPPAAEEHRAMNEELFLQLAESVNEIFWIFTPDFNQLFYVSPAYEKITGQPCQTLHENPRAWLDMVHPQDLPRVLAALGDHDDEDEIEYRIVLANQSIRWIRSKGFVVRNELGEPVRIAGVSEDITERKRLEERVRQAQKMEAIGHLAGGIAHDFNNLLTIMNGYSEILHGLGGLDETKRFYLREIRDAGERARALTRQLLAFSRNQVLAPEILDLNEVVMGIKSMLQRLIGEDVDLEARLAADVPAIKVDPSQVEQVILNLALNSRDAMPRGGRITIATAQVEISEEWARLHPQAKVGGYVRLSVTDTGAGMDAATLGRVFEPFFTTKEPGKGTGLGLATVYGIVQQSNGFIDVYSEVGRGTTFKVYFPVTSEQPVAGRKTFPPIAPPQGSETILLVEDQEEVRVLTRKLLESFGYQVLEARTGAEALDYCRCGPGAIDLLLTDVVMPGLSGRELAEKLLGLHPRLKVLYMSGYTDDAVVRHGVLSADANFLQKPFTSLALAQMIRQVLDRPVVKGMPA